MGSEILVKAVSDLIMVIFVPIFGYLVGYLVSYLKKKAHSDKVSRLLDETGRIVCLAVADTAQTYVDTIKDGKLTDAQIKKANSLAISKAKAMLGKGGLDLLQLAIGDADQYIKSLIEYFVRSQKDDVPATGAFTPIVPKVRVKAEPASSAGKKSK